MSCEHHPVCSNNEQTRQRERVREPFPLNASAHECKELLLLLHGHRLFAKAITAGNAKKTEKGIERQRDMEIEVLTMCSQTPMHLHA